MQRSEAYRDDHLKTEELVMKMLSSEFDDACVTTMKQVAASSDASETLVRKMVSHKVASDGNVEDVLPLILRLFERIAEFSEPTACIFMSHLWPIVDLVDQLMRNAQRSKAPRPARTTFARLFTRAQWTATRYPAACSGPLRSHVGLMVLVWLPRLRLSCCWRKQLQARSVTLQNFVVPEC